MSVRALLIALALTFLTGLWVRQSEIVVLATQVTESIPPIPALAGLLLLAGANALLRRLPGVRPLTRTEILAIYLFVAFASVVMGIGVSQFLLSLVSFAFYKSGDGYKELWPYFPSWLLPRDPEAMRVLYERAADGRVPWNLWLGPGLVWMGFFLALALCLHCLVGLYFRAWAEDERLSFPLITLPMEMVDEQASLFANRLFWIGFALAAAYNGINIWHAFAPSVPAIGKEVNVGSLLSDLPWSAMQPFSLHLRPEQIGLGYLVATDVSLTVWLSYFLLKLGSLLAASWGYEPRQLYPMEQGMGAYLALAIVLTFQARRRLAQAWRSERGLFVGAAAGFFGICALAQASGMAAWVAAAFFGLVVAVALVYARIRAQTGVPMVWLYPYHLQNQALYYTFGSLPFSGAGASTVVSWTLFAVVSKGYFPTISGLQAEGLEAARRERFPARQILFIALGAVATGFALGGWHHLGPYHRYGALHLRGDIWGDWAAEYEMNMAVKYLRGPVPPDLNRIAGTGAGAGVVALLSLLRWRFTSFPLSPVGYAMSACFGDILWFAFFVVWLAKTLVLRYGGMRLYRRSIPLFLGIALGHLAVAGVLWGLVGAISGEAVQGYPVFFG